MTGRIFLPVFLIFVNIFSLSCSPNLPTSILSRDLVNPPQIVLEVFAKEGKSDYFLLSDEGYSFRLIYLCENRVLNFIEEPTRNPVLVSIQPILDTPVEKRLSPDDRTRIWACMERRVWEEKSRIDELKSRVTQSKVQIEEEISRVGAEKNRMLAEMAAMAEKKRVELERQNRIEQEKRKAEEERLRREAEEGRKAAEEERKVKYYRTGEKEERPTPYRPAPVTESGIFLIMKEARVHEDPREASKALSVAEKYNIFDVINSQKDANGNHWYQVILGERVVSEKGKKYGWSPEEKSFWLRNKLPVWVFPGDIENINNVKPLKIKVDDVQFTGKSGISPQKVSFYEVTYSVNTVSREEILGWVDEKDGFRRSTKTKAEMQTLLKELSKTSWTFRIQEDVLRGYIREGFTGEQVALSWGKPDHINTTRTLVGVHEQWVYGEPPFPKSYVYFENGLVKNWEFFKNGGG